MALVSRKHTSAPPTLGGEPTLRVATWEAISSFILKQKGVETKVVDSTKGEPIKAIILAHHELGEFYNSDKDDAIIITDKEGNNLDNRTDLASLIFGTDCEPEGVCEVGLRNGILSIFDTYPTEEEIEAIFDEGYILKHRTIEL